MTAYLLRALTYPKSKWKNGRGVTRTVAIAPQGSNLETFTWRVSMADVGAAAPFSALPDIDRWLMPAAGQALAVVVDGQRSMLQVGEVLPFSGDSDTTGGVVGDALGAPNDGSRDLNLMVRRPHQGASLRSVKVAATAAVAEDVLQTDPTATRIVMVLDGELTLGETRLGKFDALMLTQLGARPSERGQTGIPDSAELLDPETVNTETALATVDTLLAVATIN